MRRTALVFLVAIAGLLFLVEKSRSSREADLAAPTPPVQTAAP